MGHKMQPTTETQLTPKQAAEVLGVCRETVMRMLRDGLMPGFKLAGKRWRIPRDEFESFCRGEWRQRIE